MDLYWGNDRETNKTTAVATEQILNKQYLKHSNRGTVGNGVFYSVRAKGVCNQGTSRANVFAMQGRPHNMQLFGFIYLLIYGLFHDDINSSD
jgi:hypothetical protein